MRALRRLLLLALFVGLFWVAWQFTHRNEGTVQVDLLVGRTPPLSLWAVLIGAFCVGAASAGAGLLFQLAKKSVATRRYRKTVAGLESEIHQLRNLPLAGAEAGLGPAPDAAGDDPARQER